MKAASGISMMIVVLGGAAWAGDVPGELARELADEGDAAGAAVEYRRLALEAEVPAERGAWFWMAGHAYWQAGEAVLAERMLDRAEDAAPELSASSVLLRGETALIRRDVDAAAFYFESAAQATGEAQPFALRRLAATRLQQGQVEAARSILTQASPPQGAGVAAVEAYAQGRDRSPRWGGWLGTVPGLGYAYAGEYANALRSLILNGIFIWGMVSTAEEEQWGGFAALTFFELTWYSGSIYGGVDASHRYNRKRLARALEAISAGAVMTPDYEALPALRLKYAF